MDRYRYNRSPTTKRRAVPLTPPGVSFDNYDELKKDHHAQKTSSEESMHECSMSFPALTRPSSIMRTEDIMVGHPARFKSPACFAVSVTTNFAPEETSELWLWSRLHVDEASPLVSSIQNISSRVPLLLSGEGDKRTRYGALADIDGDYSALLLRAHIQRMETALRSLKKMLFDFDAKLYRILNLIEQITNDYQLQTPHLGKRDTDNVKDERQFQLAETLTAMTDLSRSISAENIKKRQIIENLKYDGGGQNEKLCSSFMNEDIDYETRKKMML
ncbi:hypothetical protein PROFUN_10185 [Planoprotostelium fungivorum]|uniref:Uncharacterized protein n=1 Tax=Planoprotostelium fungivorum TaxID=1890364 RepID=A0A2P6MQ40_9EUKA|nr:hypothetical protein PROFUN_10185 [Planoprotostelium fungivorum]